MVTRSSVNREGNLIAAKYKVDNKMAIMNLCSFKLISFKLFCPSPYMGKIYSLSTCSLEVERLNVR